MRQVVFDLLVFVFFFVNVQHNSAPVWRRLRIILGLSILQCPERINMTWHGRERQINDVCVMIEPAIVVIILEGDAMRTSRSGMMVMEEVLMWPRDEARELAMRFHSRRSMICIHDPSRVWPTYAVQCAEDLHGMSQMLGKGGAYRLKIAAQHRWSDSFAPARAENHISGDPPSF